MWVCLTGFLNVGASLRQSHRPRRRRTVQRRDVSARSQASSTRATQTDTRLDLSPVSTTRFDRWPVSITRLHEPCWLARVSTSRVDGPSTRLVETRARQHGPCWRVMETGHPSTRVVNSGRGNRSLQVLHYTHKRQTLSTGETSITLHTQTTDTRLDKEISAEIFTSLVLQSPASCVRRPPPREVNIT